MGSFSSFLPFFHFIPEDKLIPYLAMMEKTQKQEIFSHNQWYSLIHLHVVGTSS